MADTNYSMICSSQDNSAAVLRLHSLGDVVLAQPAASALSKRCTTYFVTSEQYLPVVSRMKGNIHPVPFGVNSGPFALRKVLDSISPDVIIDLQNNITTKIASAGKPVKGRFRMDRKKRKRVMEYREDIMPLRSSDFLRCAGFEMDMDPVLNRIESTDHEGLRIGIVAGGRWYLKSIPPSVISEVSRILIDIWGADITLLGGAEDRKLIKRTLESVGRSNVTAYSGEGGVEGLIEIIESMDILISPDSGPAHLAAALDIPVLLIFTSTSPSLGFWKMGRIGNYMVSEAVCRPCHRHGGKSCPKGTEICRKGLLPYHLAEKAMELIES